MTLRSVSVKFQAEVAGAIANVRALGTAVSSLDTKVRESTGRQKQAFDNLSRVGTGAAIGLVGAFALATKATADFDKQMSEVKAATNASSAEMAKLRKEALQAGRDTAFSATQAAQGQTELAKAGVSTANILGGGLKGALDLAAAGQVSVGEAAEVAATAMTQFGLSGAAVPHIADLLSAGANKAQGSVHDLAFALKQSGLVASQFGLSVDDTVGTLSAFASAGLIGQDAGTSFKQMLLQLAGPSNKASDLMHQLGIEAYDAGGKFVGITGLAQQLHDKLGVLTDAQRQNALATIFGTDAIRSATVLYKQGGAGISSWIAKTNDAGNASRTAATKLDNLSGDLTKLKGSIQTALIQAGSGGTSALREMTQAATGAVNAFLALPSGVQGSLVWIAGISGAALLGAKGLIFLVGTAKDAKIALIALGVTEEQVTAITGGMRAALASTTAFLAGPWGIALATAVGVLAVFATTKKDAAKATQSLTQAIQDDSGAIGEHTRAVVANELEQAGLLKEAQSLGIGLSTVTDAVLGNKAAMDQVRSAIDDYIARIQAKKTFDKDDAARQAQQIADALKLKQALDDKNGSLNASAEAAKRQASATATTNTAQQQAAASAQKQATAENTLSQALTDASKTAEDLKAALDALSKANIDADEAAIAQRKAVTEAGKASDHHRGLVDKERTALIDLAKANQTLLVAMKADGASSQDLTAAQKRLHDQFVKLAMRMNISRAEAEKLAQRYGLLSPKTDDATSSMAAWISKAQGAAAAARSLEAHTGGLTNAQQVYTGKVRDALPVLYALAGSNQAARAQVDALARSSGIVAGKMDVSHDAFIRNAAAMGIASGRAEDLWNKLQQIKSRTANITIDATGNWNAKAGQNLPQSTFHAEGGAVPKLWAGASEAYDSQPAMLRVNEHVWTPEEVAAVGGHAAMYRMRKLARSGKLKGYASGGKVDFTHDTRSDAAVVDQVTQPIQSGMADLMNKVANAMAKAWKEFAGSGGPVVAAARSQIGVPYSWGGGGPGGPSTGIGRGAGTVGFDCSGLTEYAWWKGKGVDIGGSTGPQAANSTSISGPRPGALGFVGSPIHHVMLASDKPGMVIQAPHTGAFVEEVPRSSSNWRWPKYASGGAVGEVLTLGDAFTRGRVSLDQAMITQLLQIAGGAPRREDHSPQIVNPGDIRVFGEKESGGEAYIPLAQSKRSRSKALLAQVARAFGMGVTGLANGGIIGLADGGTTDLNLSDILSNYDNVINPASKSDVTAAAKARTKQIDQLKNAEDALAKARHKHHKDWAQIRRDERRVAQERRDVADATNHLRDVENRYRAGQQSPATKLGGALGLSIRNTGAFIANLTKLADRGFGVLAQQLLAMGGTDAEKIAADAVRMSDSKLRTIQGQITTAQKQQETLTNLPNILAVRSALKGGKGGSWAALLDATGLDPGSLATAVHLMAGELGKTSSGKSLLADMKKHGYARGGWVDGAAGVDKIPSLLTRKEFVVNAVQAPRHADLLEAINSGRLTGGRRRFAAGGWAGRAPTRGGDGATAPGVTQVFYHQTMNASQLAREAAREAAWVLS